MISVFELEDSEQWDAIVRSFQKYDVYYLSGYTKSFELHGDGKPLLFYYEGKGRDKGVRGINVVMRRDISKDIHFKNILENDRYYDFATPYGYGGWLIEDTGGCGTDFLFKDYEQWCLEHQIVSEFVRFHPMLENQIYANDFYEIVPLGETIAMELSSPENIWNNLSSKNRNVIRKAMKNNVKIYNGRYPDIYEVFRTIYNETMNKDEADSYYYFDRGFYHSLLEDLPHNSQIFYAQLPNEKIIAASVMIFANGFMNYHLSGSIKDFNSLAASNLLLYEAALWGYENGYKTLYLGGGVGSGEDNLFKFKRAFYKGALHRFYIGKKKYNEDMYKWLLDKRMDLSDNEQNQIEFFPAYRA